MGPVPGQRQPEPAPVPPGSAVAGALDTEVPRKHTLGLLTLWASGELSESDESPEWGGRWISRRTARRTRRAAPTRTAPRPPDATGTAPSPKGSPSCPCGCATRSSRGSPRCPTAVTPTWDRMAERLVDAKAAGAAALVSDLPALARHRDWPTRVLERFAYLHLLAEVHRAREHIPDILRAAVHTRAGVTTRVDEVLASGERATDTWTVLARDETDDPASGVRSRRVWLRGRTHGRTVMTLVHGREPGALTPGPTPDPGIEAEFALYPDRRRATEVSNGEPGLAPVPPGSTVTGALDTHAAQLAEDPWLHGSLVVLAQVAPARHGQDWYLADPSGDALPLEAPDPWRLLAATGGRPATVAGEWSPTEGFTPLTVWPEDTPAVPL